MCCHRRLVFNSCFKKNLNDDFIIISYDKIMITKLVNVTLAILYTSIVLAKPKRKQTNSSGAFASYCKYEKCTARLVHPIASPLVSCSRTAAPTP